MTAHYYTSVYRETIALQKYHNNLNRKEGGLKFDKIL